MAIGVRVAGGAGGAGGGARGGARRRMAAGPAACGVAGRGVGLVLAHRPRLNIYTVHASYRSTYEAIKDL